MEFLDAKVLLAEDNIVNQKVATALLDNLGCEVVLAENWERAVECVRKENFDLILMDCQMPKMDGFEATRIIHNLNTDAAKIPIIALTANAMKGDREACLAAGMQGYISKPLNRRELVNTLNHFVFGSGTMNPSQMESIFPDLQSANL